MWGQCEMNRLVAFVLLITACLSASAGDADVLNVTVSCNTDSICRFDVTVRHDDEGWEHYANRWEVLSPDGELLATRELTHPHENEQPFTRSLNNVKIPSELHEVIVRAHDLKHEYGGREIVVELPN
jgi:hypothetical protein